MAIQDLPPELLELVLLECTDQPLKLTHVCTTWRDIALKMPALWASITVAACHAESRPPVDEVRRRLELSDKHPLTLSLTCSRNPKTKKNSASSDSHDANGPGGGRGVVQVLELFLQNSYRWRAVTFDFRQQAPPTHFPASLTENGAPQLERLELLPARWSSVLEAFAMPWLTAILTNTPQLTSFVAHPGQFPRPFLDGTSWKALTQLKVATSLPAASWTQILSTTTRLVECELYNIEELHITPSHPCMLLEHLQTLVLGSRNPNTFLAFCNTITAPNLRVLELGTRAEQIWYSSQAADLVAFLRRSLCPLASLTIREPDAGGPGPMVLRDVFQCVGDSLVEFCLTSDVSPRPELAKTISNRDITGIWRNTGLRQQTVDDFAGGHLPQLERLAVHLGAQSADGVFARMVASRWKGKTGVAKLSRVEVVCEKGAPHSQDVEILEGLFSEGLQGSLSVRG